MTFNESEYQALYNKIVNGVNHAVSLVNHIIHIVEDATSWIPWVGGQIAGLCNKLVAKMNEFTADVMNHLKVFGIPSALNSDSSSWTGIEQEAGNLYSSVQGEQQSAGSIWKGIAGGAYQTGVSNQGGAVSTIKSLAATMSSTAEGVANAGFAFYVCVGAAIVSLILGLAGAIAVFPAIAGIIVAVVAIAGGYTNLRLQISSNTRTVQGLVSGDGFPNGKWPTATTS